MGNGGRVGVHDALGTKRASVQVPLRVPLRLSVVAFVAFRILVSSLAAIMSHPLCMYVFRVQYNDLHHALAPPPPTTTMTTQMAPPPIVACIVPNRVGLESRGCPQLPGVHARHRGDSEHGGRPSDAQRRPRFHRPDAAGIVRHRRSRLRKGCCSAQTLQVRFHRSRLRMLVVLETV